MIRVLNAVAALVGVAIVGGLLTVGTVSGYVAVSKAAEMAVPSYLDYRARIAAKEGFASPERAKAYRDKWAFLECPAYFDAGYLYRAIRLRGLSWCEAYRG